MNKSALIILLAFTACCTEPEINVKHPDLEVYYFRFMQEAAIRHKAITVDYQITLKFADLSGDRVGNCWQSASGNDRVIRIDPTWFNKEDDLTLIEFVLFHELGHCVLCREHLNDLNDDGEPISIMNESPISDYASRREELLNELFRKEVVR